MAQSPPSFRTTLGIFAATAVLVCTCSDKGSNPVTPAGTSTPPTEFVMEDCPRENAVLEDPTVEVAWRTPGDSCEFSWRVDGGEWSQWVPDTALRQLLDDGKHTIDLRCRCLTGEGR